MCLQDFADVAQVIIALANLVLASYIFVFQRKKSHESDLNTARLNEQNIKLQWFKELVLQPNLHKINSFYTNLNTIPLKITSNDMSQEERININEFIKSELKMLRQTFVDLLLQVDKEFGDKVLSNLDGLIDELTEAIFNEELKLKHPVVSEKQILSKVSYSRNSLMGLVFNYKGT